MSKTTIIVHLPAHRRRSLELERNTAEAEQAYDHNIGGYIRFLQEEAGHTGFEVKTDARDPGTPFTIDETSHEEKKAARAWLESQPDLWNWIP